MLKWQSGRGVDKQILRDCFFGLDILYGVEDNIAICKEELSYTTGEKYQEIQFQIPVEENESGIQSIEIWYGPYASFGEGFSSAWSLVVE